VKKLPPAAFDIFPTSALMIKAVPGLAIVEKRASSRESPKGGSTQQVDVLRRASWREWTRSMGTIRRNSREA
jgi:hypothetical protein